MLLVTPQAANKTIGQGGFQEVRTDGRVSRHGRLPGRGARSGRIPEVLNRVICKAKRLSAPAQINMPRDFWTQVIDVPLPAAIEFERPAGGSEGDRRSGAAAVRGEHSR